jgi:antitoxin (DNA-binding transcriptional repressor) of toxin-antitoxin stability system
LLDYFEFLALSQAVLYIQHEVEVYLYSAARRAHMQTVSVLEFRKNAEKFIRWSRQGKRMLMTYRGRPVMRLEPVEKDKVGKDDPFLQLDGIAGGKKERLSNREIDGIVYGA